MKLLFFSTYYHPYLSGITTYPQKLLYHLSQHHSINILTFRHDPSLPKLEHQQNLTINRMPYCFKLSKGFISLQSLLYFIKSTQKTDTVILNLPNFEGLPLAIIAKLLKKPVISIFHCRVTLAPGLINRLLELAINTSVYFQLKLSHKVVVYTKDYFTSLNWHSSLKNKVTYILPPVDKLAVDSNYLKQLRQEKSNQIWIGFAGRVAQEKGLTYLIDAVSQLPQNYSLKLIFAGPTGKEVVGESHYYQTVIQKLKQKKIKYRFLGKLHLGKLGAFYQAIDLLVLPSINQTEAFGMVQVEAMLLGTPVIASNLPGVRIPVQKTGLGLITFPRNSKQLQQAIVNLLANRKKFVNHVNLNTAHQLFDSQVTFNRYDQLIGSLKPKALA